MVLGKNKVLIGELLKFTQITMKLILLTYIPEAFESRQFSVGVSNYPWEGLH